MPRRVFFLLLVCVGSFGSKIEINETLLDWFPPLYALDNWASCQRPMDTYCIVDAVLRSSKPSPLLDTLEKYSSETYKHYNRTQIHRGVCMSRCEGKHQPDNLIEIAQSCINQSIKPYDLEAQVISVEWCKTADASRDSTSARVMAVVMATLLVVIATATGVHCVDSKLGNKYMMAFSLKKNWEILTSVRLNQQQEPRMKDLRALDGIKVLGIQTVFFTHIILIHAYSFTDNPEFVERFYDHFVWKVLMNTPTFLQVFFAMSGFTTTYMFLILTENQKLTLKGWIYSIVNRWFRLVPVVIFVLWFTMAWFPLLGSGPHWSWVVEKEAQDCSYIWWYYLFFAQNFIGTERYCLSHLWYVAVDMQFHIFGMLLLVLLTHYRWLVTPILLVLFVASGVASGVVNYIHSYLPIIAGQPPEILRTLFSTWPQVSHIYIAPWMNPGFIAGVAIGFIHYRNHQKGIKLNENKWFCVLSHLSLYLCTGVAALGVFFLADDPPAMWVSALYSSIDRPLSTVCLSILILGFVSKCESPLFKVCLWSGFRVLAKLSYCAYIIHFIILRVIMGNNGYLFHSSIFSMFCFVILTTFLTYIACIPVYLIIELPLIRLCKAVFETQRPMMIPPIIKMEQQTNGHIEI